MNSNTLQFIRDFHRIPKKQKLAWCIIHYPDAERPERCLRLGVLLVGTSKAIDIADGIFIQNCQNQNAMKATRKKVGDWYVYECEEGYAIQLPDSFIEDMYFKRIYSTNLINYFLL